MDQNRVSEYKIHNWYLNVLWVTSFYVELELLLKRMFCSLHSPYTLTLVQNESRVPTRQNHHMWRERAPLPARPPTWGTHVRRGRAPGPQEVYRGRPRRPTLGDSPSPQVPNPWGEGHKRLEERGDRGASLRITRRSDNEDQKIGKRKKFLKIDDAEAGLANNSFFVIQGKTIRWCKVDAEAGNGLWRSVRAKRIGGGILEFNLC